MVLLRSNSFAPPSHAFWFWFPLVTACRVWVGRLRAEPAAYGQLGLANLLDMREDCLREFNFRDAYRTVKERSAPTAASL